jgi:hypothetical protein
LPAAEGDGGAAICWFWSVVGTNRDGRGLGDEGVTDRCVRVVVGETGGPGVIGIAIGSAGS